MTKDVHRSYAGASEPGQPKSDQFTPIIPRASLFSRLSVGKLWSAKLLAGGFLAAGLLAVFSGHADAQQTLVIGGGGAGGVTVNYGALENPYAPYSGYSGTPYRQPGTGELLVTRPSTLLFPPMQHPQSHIAEQQSFAAQGQVPTLTRPGSQQVVSGPPKSQLLVPLPPGTELPAAPRLAQAPTPAPAAPAAPVAPVIKQAVVPPPPTTTPMTEPEVKVASKAPPPPPPPAAEVQPIPVPPPPVMQAEIKPEAPATPAVTPEAPEVSQTKEPAMAATEQPVPVPPAPPAAESMPEAPKVEVAKTEDTAAASTAALPPSTTEDGEVRLLFASGSAELSKTSESELQALAQALLQDEKARIQLMAYAADSDNNTSRARRLSLSRALAVRAFLIEQGVRSTRIDVRALGSKTQTGPADRVDILPQGASG